MINNIFKCFGITKNEVKSIIADIFANSEGVLITLIENGPELTIKLESDNNLKVLEKSSEIYRRIGNYIYAEEDISIYEAAFSLLKLNNLTLATAESITAGNIAASFVKNNEGASQILLEGDVVYTNDAKKRMLNITDEMLEKHTDVSAETTYSLAYNLLEKTKASIVIATTGYASGMDETQNGLNFIAIGDKTKIDIFKNKFNGNRNDVIETVTMAAFFYLIKKLRQNNFYFEKNLI